MRVFLKIIGIFVAVMFAIWTVIGLTQGDYSAIPIIVVGALGFGAYKYIRSRRAKGTA